MIALIPARERWTPDEIGWVAGIIEGEGTIRVRKKNAGVEVAVKMTDEDVIRRLREVTQIGNVTGPRCFAPPRQPQWTWSCTSMKDVSRLLLAIYPLMGQRRRARIGEAADRMGERVRSPARCGTIGGYGAHRRKREPQCDSCKAANAARQRQPHILEYKRAWRAKQREGQK